MYSLADIFITVGLLILLYMAAWFLLAVFLKRRDVVDSAWGLGFIVVAAVAYTLRNNESIIANLTFVFVSIWGLRLAVHITRRNWKKKEDYRYAQMGNIRSVLVWLRIFVTVFVLQGLLMIIISAPIIAIMQTTSAALNWLAIVGFVVWGMGIFIEATADYQLRQFLQSKRKGIMQSGLWKYSRHPNYFGEITSWWGAVLVAGAFAEWWGVVSALVITLLIVKVSGIPLLEKRYAKDPEYQKYAKRTSILIPLPVKNRGN